MNILYVGLARSLWMFDTALLNPKGINLQAVIDGIKERYRFAQSPKHQLDLDERRGLTFKSGTFRNSQGIPILVTFSLYNDGFVADSPSSTDDSTEFLNDLAVWSQKEYGLVVPSNIKKTYVGQIDFETDAQLVSLNPRLVTFVKLLEARFRPPDNRRLHFDVSSLGLWTENFGEPSAPSPFRYERKIGAPFASNHYFSQAPLETQAHIELLNELERLLRG